MVGAWSSIGFGFSFWWKSFCVDLASWTQYRWPSVLGSIQSIVWNICLPLCIRHDHRAAAQAPVHLHSIPSRWGGPPSSSQQTPCQGDLILIPWGNFPEISGSLNEVRDKADPLVWSWMPCIAAFLLLQALTLTASL